jgi:hypothetical protein
LSLKEKKKKSLKPSKKPKAPERVSFHFVIKLSATSMNTRKIKSAAKLKLLWIPFSLNGNKTQHKKKSQKKLNTQSL